MTREKELNIVSQKAFSGIERSNTRGAQSLWLGLDDKSWIPQPVYVPHEPAPFSEDGEVADIGLGMGMG